MDTNFAIMGLIGFLGLWIAYHVVWCASLKTMFRQRLFRLRDCLFLEAAQGNIDFGDPAYGMLRMMMQRTLAASENINTVQVLAAVILAPRLRDGSTSLVAKFSSTVAAMPNRKRAAIYDQYHKSLLLLLANHLVQTMPVPVLGTIIFFVLCRIPGLLGGRLLSWAQSSRQATAAKYVEAAYHLPKGIALT